MKYSWFSLLGLATLAFVSVSTTSEAAPCAASTVVGAYTVKLTGTDATGAAIVEQGVVVFQDDGSFYLSDQPNIAAVTQPIGTWNIASDCLLTVSISDSFAGAIRFGKAVGYVSFDGNLIQFVTSSTTLAQMSGQALRNP